MGYRNIFLVNAVRLSVKNEQLLIDNGEVVKVPLEDIECIVCDSLQVNVTSYLLMKFNEYSITFFVTNKSHHPCGVFLPINKHSRHLSVLKKQIEMKMPAKKKLWKQIIIQKIENQATVLQLNGIKEWQSVDNMKLMVKSGDSTNIEAVAANKYFRLLFGSKFTRGQKNIINSCLNYGYAILRSTIEKNLIVYGYEPSLGLFHKSTLNNFNLADDFIEPFRPLVDLFVKKFVENSDYEEINTLLKAQLVNLLSNDVIVDNKLYACSKAIELSIQSLSGFLSENRNNLILPYIIDLEQHSYE